MDLHCASLNLALCLIRSGSRSIQQCSFHSRSACQRKIKRKKNLSENKYTSTWSSTTRHKKKTPLSAPVMSTSRRRGSDKKIECQLELGEGELFFLTMGSQKKSFLVVVFIYTFIIIFEKLVLILFLIWIILFYYNCLFTNFHS